jgi:hypothetical protein
MVRTVRRNKEGGGDQEMNRCKYKEVFEPTNAECDKVCECATCGYREKWWDYYLDGQEVRRQMIEENGEVWGEDYYG